MGGVGRGGGRGGFNVEWREWEGWGALKVQCNGWEGWGGNSFERAKEDMG
jgi:hypothetical protein